MELEFRENVGRNSLSEKDAFNHDSASSKSGSMYGRRKVENQNRESSFKPVVLERQPREFDVLTMRAYGQWLEKKKEKSPLLKRDTVSMIDLSFISSQTSDSELPQKTKKKLSLGDVFFPGIKKEVDPLPTQIADLMFRRQECTAKSAHVFDKRVAQLDDLRLVYDFATQPISKYGESSFDQKRFIDKLIKKHKKNLIRLILEMIEFDLESRKLNAFPELFRGDTFVYNLASKVCDILDQMEDGSEFTAKVAEKMLDQIQFQETAFIEQLVISSKDVRVQLEKQWVFSENEDFSQLDGERQNALVEQLCLSRVESPLFLGFIGMMLTHLFPKALETPKVMGLVMPDSFQNFLCHVGLCLQSKGAKKRAREEHQINLQAVAAQQVGALVFLKRVNSKFILEAKRRMDRVTEGKESLEYRHAVGVYAATLGVSKILQQLVNGAPFGEKEQQFLSLNENLDKYFVSCRHYLQSLAGVNKE